MDRAARERFAFYFILAGAIISTIYGLGRFKEWYAQQILTQIVDDELETKIAKKVEERLTARVQEVLQSELESVREEVEKNLLAREPELESIGEVVEIRSSAEKGKVKTKPGLKKGNQGAVESHIKENVRREMQTLIGGTFTSQMAKNLSR